MSIWSWLKSKSEQEVPDDGMTAYYDGFQRDKNPYKQHTPEHSIWRDEWLNAAGRFR